jgi:hypothetical protein
MHGMMPSYASSFVLLGESSRQPCTIQFSWASNEEGRRRRRRSKLHRRTLKEKSKRSSGSNQSGPVLDSLSFPEFSDISTSLPIFSYAVHPPTQS